MTVFDLAATEAIESFKSHCSDKSINTWKARNKNFLRHEYIKGI